MVLVKLPKNVETSELLRNRLILDVFSQCSGVFSSLKRVNMIYERNLFFEFERVNCISCDDSFSNTINLGTESDVVAAEGQK